MLITIKDIANKARENKRFIRFLKETKLMGEYFRNINLHGFSPFITTQSILDKQLISYAFNWGQTDKPATWENMSSIWTHFTLLKGSDTQDFKQVLKIAKECIESHEN